MIEKVPSLEDINAFIGEDLVCQLQIVNKEFTEKFLPSKERIMRVDPKMPWANNVIYKNLILGGSPGSGKTTEANKIAGMIVDKYGEENVNCVFCEDGDLDKLMRIGLKPKMVNVLFADNVTLTVQNKETLVKFFTMRNQFHDRFGLKNGYILTIISLHRYHGISVDLRSIVDGIIFRGTSLNPYDRSVIKKFMDNDTLFGFLDQVEDLRENDRKMMDVSIYIGKGGVKGVLTLELKEKFHFKEPPKLVELMGMYLDRIRRDKEEKEAKEKEEKGTLRKNG